MYHIPNKNLRSLRSRLKKSIASLGSNILFSYVHIYPGTLLNSSPLGHIPIFLSSSSTWNPDAVLATQAQLATSISGNSMATPPTEATLELSQPVGPSPTLHQKDSKLRIFHNVPILYTKDKIVFILYSRVPLYSLDLPMCLWTFRCVDRFNLSPLGGNVNIL